MAPYIAPGMTGGGGGSFIERTTALSKLVGQGKISAEVKVDQIYARRQHQGASYAHPRGGQAFFLRDALNSSYREHLQRVAMTIYNGSVQAEFIGYAERVAADSSRRTPVELGNLRDSDSATVKVQGRIIYRRPARKGRMSRSQLNSRIRAHHIERTLRRLGGG